MEKKYGKSTHEQRAREEQNAMAAENRYQNEMKDREARKIAENERIREREKREADARHEDMLARNRIEQIALEAEITKSTKHKKQQAENPAIIHEENHGAINPFTGEFLAPAGDGYVGTRDGTYYTPSGPNGIINTRTGQFSPVTR